MGRMERFSQPGITVCAGIGVEGPGYGYGRCMTANFPAASLEPETDGPLILALPKGRILDECGPLLARAGIVPAADYHR